VATAAAETWAGVVAAGCGQPCDAAAWGTRCRLSSEVEVVKEQAATATAQAETWAWSSSVASGPTGSNDNRSSVGAWLDSVVSEDW
jgi:hypothetical protein